jgi:hypothetical protein
MRIKAVSSTVLLFIILCSMMGGIKIPTSAAAQPNFYIGQHYGGGIIFYVDSTGQHGLIAATSDTSYLPIWWGDRHYPLAGATGTAVGTGAVNTKKIIAVQGTGYSYAALVCANYRGGGYSDWFLPSKDELYLLYKQKSVVGGFIRGGYWSSSEYVTPFDHTLAWQKYFYNDVATLSHKDRVDGVRAIRAF